MKAARVNVNLTQKQAAQQLGISRTTLQNWERGKSYPTIEKFAIIKSTYGVDYDDIFLPHVNANSVIS